MKERLGPLTLVAALICSGLTGCGKPEKNGSNVGDVNLNPPKTTTLDLPTEGKKFPGGGDPMGIASIWILLGGAGASLAGFSLLRRGK